MVDNRSPFLSLLRMIASLKATVLLFLLSVILVFFGTVAQRSQGLRDVVDGYFWSWHVTIDLQLAVDFGTIFFDVPKGTKAKEWLKVPFPAGKSIGTAMFVNLIAAHLLQLMAVISTARKLSTPRARRNELLTALGRKSGIYILHLGVILLFVGEFITREQQVEQRMLILPNETVSYTENIHEYDLVFIDDSSPTEDRLIMIPDKLLERALRKGESLSDERLPFVITPVVRYANSSFERFSKEKEPSVNLATAGVGLKYRVQEMPAAVVSDQSIDLPSYYVEMKNRVSGADLGVRLAAGMMPRIGDPKTDESQQLHTDEISVDGKVYKMQLRPHREYKPYSLTLLEFRFDRYPGSTMARNYSSRLRLDDPDTGTREVLIRMNDPLNQRGETYYQQGFTPSEDGTALQVVRNPGKWLPYVACILVALGMLVQFGISLFKFLSKIEIVSKGTGWPSVVGALLATVFLTTLLFPRAARSEKFDLSAAARIPILDSGRIKPLDSFARGTLRILAHTEEIKHEGKTISALQWWFDVTTGTKESKEYRVFRIDNDRVAEFLQLERREGRRYSLKEIRDQIPLLYEAATIAENIPRQSRDTFQAQLIATFEHVKIYEQVANHQLAVIPAEGDLPRKTLKDEYVEARELVRDLVTKRRIVAGLFDENLSPDEQAKLRAIISESWAEIFQKHTSLYCWDRLLESYISGDVETFDSAAREAVSLGSRDLTSNGRRQIAIEEYLNESAPFYQFIILYLLGAMATAMSWLVSTFQPTRGAAIRTAASQFLAIVCLANFAALVARMFIMDRPLVFVTNLYSSAIFIGCFAVFLTLIVESFTRLGIASFAGAVIGGSTAILAHNLADVEADTLGSLVAVLDTNFWLATHVTCIAIGYASTYVAGILAIIALFLGMIIHTSSNIHKLLGKVIYSVVCFAMLTSFVGTVLGGIWADQSWGRFWGWDPKENGAVMIVLWNALILHARWGGMVQERGIARLAVVGSMITTWSWFGTNQLSVGLHAYGFSQTLAAFCKWFWYIHVTVLVAEWTFGRTEKQ